MYEAFPRHPVMQQVQAFPKTIKDFQETNGK
jgi:hypothetical protein